MMTKTFDDLREYINRVEELGECKVIDGADWNLEIGVISELYLSTPNPPLLLFDKIIDYKPGYRVASNVIITPRRTALCLGLPLEAKGIELVNAWRHRSKGIKLIPPVEVKRGPVKENIYTGEDVDLFEFPVPKWREFDGGRYIGTGDTVIQRDPEEGWVNLGTYRVQIHDKCTATIYMSPGKHGDIIRRKYWNKGQSCPVAVVCGQDPLLWEASCDTLPWGMSEYDYAGALRNAPIEVVKGEVTDLPIPARAELVLEGEILPPEVETRMEGPFGEWTGYYASGSRSEPAFKVKAILHRNDPIIMGMPMFGGSDAFDTHLKKAARVWDDLDRQVANVKGVWMFLEGDPGFIVVVSIKQSYAGHAKQAALVAAGCNAISHMYRFIIVVDDDIDITKTSEVIKVMATRCDVEDSFDFVRSYRSSYLDPVLSPEKKGRGELFKTIALITACKPFPWMKEFPQLTRSSPALLEKVNKKWQISDKIAT